MFEALKKYLRRDVKVAEPVVQVEQQPAPVAPAPQGMAISYEALYGARIRNGRTNQIEKNTVNLKEVFRSLPKPPFAVDTAIIAQDSNDYGQWASEQMAQLESRFAEGTTFLGYAYLSELAQRAEYRVISETLASEMTRKWIRFVSVKDEDAADVGTENSAAEKIKELEAKFLELNVRGVIQKAIEQDGYFGRGHIYIELKNADRDPQENSKSIGDGWDKMSKAKIGTKLPVVALRNVEALWCYPTSYNSNNPLRSDWYNPSEWLVQATRVHSSRLITLIGRPVPDLLKPTYSFGGLSMSQMVKPYVDNWLNTRQSVSDILQSFTTWVLTTNLQSALQGDGAAMYARAEVFNSVKSNQGLMVLDGTEQFQNVSAPLAGLESLQSQAQEHMASVSHIPTVKLLGIQPAGLNASSEGELRSFYDWIAAAQESQLRKPIHTIMGLVMLSLWDEVDKDITFKFEPLWSMDEDKLATIELTKAQTDQVYVEMGVLAPEEVRQRVATDPDSGHSSIDVSDMPEQPEEDDMGGLSPDDDAPKGGPGGGGKSVESFPPASVKVAGAEDDSFDPAAHPKAPAGQPNGGQFVAKGSGGGAATATKEKKEKKAASGGVPKNAVTGQAIVSFNGKWLNSNQESKLLQAGLTNAGSNVITIKDKSVVHINNTSGAWTISTPGYQTKTGIGYEALEALLTKPMNEWQAAGVTNYDIGNSLAPNPVTIADITEASAPDKPPAPKFTPAPATSSTTSTQSSMEKAAQHQAEMKKVAKKNLATIRAVRPKPTDSEQAAITHYKGAGYTSMNKALRENKPNASTEQVKKWLDRASLPEDVTVYRAVKADFAAMLKSTMDVGCEFVDRGFVSTTTNPAFAEGWKNDHDKQMLLTIRAKKGQKGAAVMGEGQSYGGETDSEYEVLMQAGTRFKVVEFDWDNSTMICDMVEPYVKPAAEPVAQPQQQPTPQSKEPEQTSATSGGDVPELSEEPTATTGKMSPELKKAVKKNPSGYKIQMVVKGNPKKAGSASYEVFKNYKDGMTVQEFQDAMGGWAATGGHLDWDAEKGFIKIVKA